MRLLLLFLFFASVLNAQTGNAVIGLPNSSVLYRGYDNVVEIGFTHKIPKKYSIEYAGCDTFYHLTGNKYAIRATETDSIVSLKIQTKGNKLVETIHLKTVELPSPVILINGKYTNQLQLDTIPEVFSLITPPSVPVKHYYPIQRWTIRIDDKVFKGRGIVASTPQLIDYLHTTKNMGMMIIEIEYHTAYQSKTAKKIREVWLFGMSNPVISDE